MTGFFIFLAFVAIAVIVVSIASIAKNNTYQQENSLKILQEENKRKNLEIIKIEQKELVLKEEQEKLEKNKIIFENEKKIFLQEKISLRDKYKASIDSLNKRFDLAVEKRASEIFEQKFPEYKQKYLKKENELSETKLKYEKLCTEKKDETNKAKLKYEKLCAEKENEIRNFKREIEPSPAIISALINQFNTDEVCQSLLNGNLSNAFNTPITFQALRISATIRSGESIYTTTLTDCNCKYYINRHIPCKHMLLLAHTIGILQISQKQYSFRNNYFAKACDELQALKSQIQKLKSQILPLKERVKVLEKKEALLQKINEKLTEATKCSWNSIDGKSEFFKSLAMEISESETSSLKKIEYILQNKTRPALTAADTVRNIRREMKKILAEKKEYEYQLNYIRELFPNIDDIFDTGFNEQEQFELETSETTDRTRFFLSPEEYKKLSTAERNQLALDRYIERRKSKWQIGRDYEMYIGYCLESKDFTVQYNGIVEKLEDMGRDLIANKNNQTYIIQCKNWSQEKIIHEKHIFQLYGTIILYKINNPSLEVRGAFVTTTILSKTAKIVAKELDIEVFEKLALKDFPRIKCNINNVTGEKIYHLPFDEQYDSTIIDKNAGEFYALTVAEAEKQGFRRAWRHLKGG